MNARDTDITISLNGILLNDVLSTLVKVVKNICPNGLEITIEGVRLEYKIEQPKDDKTLWQERCRYMVDFNNNPTTIEPKGSGSIRVPYTDEQKKALLERDKNASKEWQTDDDTFIDAMKAQLNQWSKADNKTVEANTIEDEWYEAHKKMMEYVDKMRLVDVSNSEPGLVTYGVPRMKPVIEKIDTIRKVQEDIEKTILGWTVESDKKYTTQEMGLPIDDTNEECDTPIQVKAE